MSDEVMQSLSLKAANIASVSLLYVTCRNALHIFLAYCLLEPQRTFWTLKVAQLLAKVLKTQAAGDRLEGAV